MVQDENIPNVMKNHHYKLEGMLHRLNKFESDSEEFQGRFQKFKWELEKHFFLEEKAIFIHVFSDDERVFDMKEALKKEHNVILSKLDELEDDLKKEPRVETISEFRNRLKAHREFEDENFYPILESELDDSRKKKIINKITNPV